MNRLLRRRPTVIRRRGGYRPATSDLKPEPVPDMVNHPAHYTSSPACCTSCGAPIECIDVVRHQPFNLGAVIKYIWRLGLKGDPIEQLEKAVWHLRDEVELRKRQRDAP